MPKYRFSSLDTDGALQSSCIIEARSDEEARDIARDLLMESRPATVEAWDVFRLVCRAGDAHVADENVHAINVSCDPLAPLVPIP